MRIDTWQRPKTTRRYFHPPMSERMYTVWREGKIVFGENEVAVRNQYYDLISAGMWFLDGEGRPFDFHDARLYQREDGIPVHGLGFKLGEVRAEAAVKRADMPIMIIHGDQDDFVPFYMGKKIADANPKIRFEVFCAKDHGLSYISDTERYVRLIKEFTKECLEANDEVK